MFFEEADSEPPSLVALHAREDPYGTWEDRREVIRDRGGSIGTRDM